MTRYLPKLTENLYVHKDLFMKVYNIFINNCQKSIVTQMSFHGQNSKQSVVHPYNGIYLAIKVLIDTTTWMHLKVLRWVKETSLKGNTLYDYVYDIMEIGKLWQQRIGYWLAGVRGSDKVVTTKKQPEGVAFSDGTVLCPYCDGGPISLYMC